MKITLYNVDSEQAAEYVLCFKDVVSSVSIVDSDKYKDHIHVVMEATPDVTDKGSGDELFRLLDNHLEYYNCYVFPHNNVDTAEMKVRDIILERNLLIVGNGFDIGHGMKTKYGDFLDQVEKLYNILAKKYINDSFAYDILNNVDYETEFIKNFNVLFGSLDEELDRNFGIESFWTTEKGGKKSVKKNTQKFLDRNRNKDVKMLDIATKVLKEILKDSNSGDSYSAYDQIRNVINKHRIKWFLAELYIKDNNLIRYFLKKHEDIGENWIDIESEISYMIQYLEIFTNYINNRKINSPNLEILKKTYWDELQGFSNLVINPDEYIEVERKQVKDVISTLESQLGIFVFLLENYLINEEQQIKKNSLIKDVFDIIAPNVTHVLSFNYTDTFRHLYYEVDDKNIDFIHGKIGEHNLVLGSSETLDHDNINTDLSCIYFKKYFQRIYKKIGAKYSKWLMDSSFQNVYIYGHSLDVTDREVLSNIIKNDSVRKVNIFYYDENHYRQEISNLVQVLDKDTLLEYVADGKIEFIKQSNIMK